MKLTARSSLRDVVQCVARALSRAGIRAVLTGGACATLYTAGRYLSEDLDFILQTPVSKGELDAAMRSTGFRRRGNQYVHEHSRFFVEFPAGPLGVGADLNVQPVKYGIRRTRVLALSPTDSCRDRLAAFYHWTDRQSLEAAVQIAARRRVDLRTIRSWSAREGFESAFEEFARELKRARRSMTGHPRKKKPLRRSSGGTG